MPIEGGRAGADRVWWMGWPFRARRRFRGLRLVATDVSWSRGEEHLHPLSTRGPTSGGRAPPTLVHITDERGGT